MCWWQASMQRAAGLQLKLPFAEQPSVFCMLYTSDSTCFEAVMCGGTHEAVEVLTLGEGNFVLYPVRRWGCLLPADMGAAHRAAT